jgi:hypothetical protein
MIAVSDDIQNFGKVNNNKYGNDECRLLGYYAVWLL